MRYALVRQRGRVGYSSWQRAENAPEFTIEQYASYSPARVALATYWGKRFEEEPALKAKFETLQAEFVAWLRTKGAKPR